MTLRRERLIHVIDARGGEHFVGSEAGAARIRGGSTPSRDLAIDNIWTSIEASEDELVFLLADVAMALARAAGKDPRCT